MPRTILVLGGARSGKSHYALERARVFGGDAVTFVATARPGDPELDRRIAEHRRERPAPWETVETAGDLALAVRRADPRNVLLIDSLTLWVAGLGGGTRLGASWEAACAALHERHHPVVLVSDEVGLGLVPRTPSGRRFRDELGWLNQQAAALSDEVSFVVAGLPLALKSGR